MSKVWIIKNIVWIVLVLLIIYVLIFNLYLHFWLKRSCEALDKNRQEFQRCVDNWVQAECNSCGCYCWDIWSADDYYLVKDYGCEDAYKEFCS